MSGEANIFLLNLSSIEVDISGSVSISIVAKAVLVRIGREYSWRVV